jgi:hypothetical protein
LNSDASIAANRYFREGIVKPPQKREVRSYLSASKCLEVYLVAIGPPPGLEGPSLGTMRSLDAVLTVDFPSIMETREGSSQGAKRSLEYGGSSAPPGLRERRQPFQSDFISTGGFRQASSKDLRVVKEAGGGD